jgi:quercetin dioxygenase-like cupin family protein
MLENQEPLGKPLPMSSFIQYADHAVVSKQLIKQKTGTVSLFAFDKGQSLSEHTAPFEAFVEIVDGAAEIIINHQSYSIKTGEFIILPANVPHAVNAVERFKMVITMIKE